MTKAQKPPRRAVSARRKAGLPAWSEVFLQELAATSNVSAAARKAGISSTAAYDARRSSPAFHRRWLEALCEGYDHLELELLHRLRSGEIRPPAGAKRGVRVFDNGAALRLLAAHRASAAQQRAIRDNEDTETILASINAKLERMRQRRLAQQKPAPDAG